MKWKIILVVAAVLALFAARTLQWSPPRLLSRFDIDPILLAAQGFGLGRIRFGPGTFGSLGGLLLFALLLCTRSAWLFALGSLAAIFISVWLCGRGEKILRQKDPGSIVMDEIIAIPICFCAWLWFVIHRTGIFPGPAYFFKTHWVWTIAVFGLFRLFDILKPWPISRSQSLPGGWGVTVDDVLAAIYVNVVSVVLYALKIARL